MTMRVILKRKIMVQEKSQSSVVAIRLMQLTIFKACFHLEVETGFMTSLEMLKL